MCTVHQNNYIPTAIHYIDVKFPALVYLAIVVGYFFPTFSALYINILTSNKAKIVIYQRQPSVAIQQTAICGSAVKLPSCHRSTVLSSLSGLLWCTIRSNIRWPVIRKKLVFIWNINYSTVARRFIRMHRLSRLSPLSTMAREVPHFVYHGFPTVPLCLARYTFTRVTREHSVVSEMLTLDQEANDHAIFG